MNIPIRWSSFAAVASSALIAGIPSWKRILFLLLILISVTSPSWLSWMNWNVITSLSFRLPAGMISLLPRSKLSLIPMSIFQEIHCRMFYAWMSSISPENEIRNIVSSWSISIIMSSSIFWKIVRNIPCLLIFVRLISRSDPRRRFFSCYQEHFGCSGTDTKESHAQV